MFARLESSPKTIVRVLPGNDATVFIKSVFYFVISHGRNRVVRESAAHVSIQLCRPCIKKVITHFFFTQCLICTFVIL